MAKQLEKKYDPAAFEERLYAEWSEKGYFRPNKPGAKPFSIVMPPPNITGQLHMGHALDNTLQDLLVRYKRMCGYNTLWVPGTDHASIATEAKIVEKMREEGVTKEDIGREAFLDRAWEWNRVYGGRITEQLRKIGSSCDWERQRFTMDEGCSEAVKDVFVRLYKKGLIYRGNRIINWCPHCLTSISDAEVEYEEQAGHFWHLRYPVKDSDEYIYLATTRPETLLGDTAVAVNPKDERYAHLVGKTLILPLVGREIPVVADDYVEMDFGTGVVKITPAHDPNDFEVGLRHNLEVINVMTPDAHINEDYPAYAGMDRFEARKAIVKDLEAGGYLVRVENYAHNVGTCYRCGTTIEPRVSLQWFVKMEELAKPAIEAVKTGEIRFIPDRFSKNYLHWMENIRDWCISRQLWWGHRIPAFYCDDCGELVVTADASAVCPKCGGPMRQDPDTLDTWFSSALWPFSTLGWPKQTEDLATFYPTSTLVTGYDIITFWVSRMIFSGLEHTGEKPFSDVLVHGLVRDALGRKMSKSLGNGIDPLEVIRTYGCDALRFSLVSGNSPGNDMRVSDERFESARNFANKIWNAARFVLMNLDEEDAVSLEDLDLANLPDEDKWILSNYNRTVREVRDNLDRYELGVALGKLYDFIWDVFCDWYIELVKARLGEKGTQTNRSAQKVLIYVLSGTMALLHPFMPFITEEIWRTLPHAGDSVMVSDYPAFHTELDFPQEEEAMRKVIDAIRAVRNLRSEMGVANSRRAHLRIVTADPTAFGGKERFFEKLAYASGVEVSTEAGNEQGCVRAITDACEILIPIADMIDREEELARLNKELANAENELSRAQSKLANAEFVAKAPQKLVDGERAKEENAKSKLEKIRAAIANLENM
ncbi:MAG: valine--tRNA ligase [Oscillospiraceae bacterium]|nr:valine--tRNA ligase [Oscillospiraceae bacterium]